MTANKHLHTDNASGRRDNGTRDKTTRDYVVLLHGSLVPCLASATHDGDVFRMNLIGGALGGLAKGRVFETLEENTRLEEEQEIAVLLCEAVYLFELSCAELKGASTPPQDPVMIIIRNRTRGEDLAKIVIDSGLNYLVNRGSRGSFGIRHLQTPYRYFHSHLKEALEKAEIELPRGDIRAEVAAARQNVAPPCPEC